MFKIKLERSHQLQRTHLGKGQNGGNITPYKYAQKDIFN